MAFKTIWLKYQDGGQQKTIGLLMGEKKLKNLDVEFDWTALGVSAASKLRKKSDRANEPLVGQTKGKLRFGTGGTLIICDGETRGRLFGLVKTFDKSTGTKGSGEGEFVIAGHDYTEQMFWSVETIVK